MAIESDLLYCTEGHEERGLEGPFLRGGRYPTLLVLAITLNNSLGLI